jgi:hypothetical protein
LCPFCARSTEAKRVSEYEWDVAFSFLSKDEALAQRLHSLASATMKSFHYSERQELLAGTDGEKTLNKVFGKEARVVVVLYRHGWGETPFTRIEDMAIRNRAFSEGYAFVLLVPLDEPAEVPPWIPKPYVWFSLGRFGEDTLLAIIEERVRQAGGNPRVETPEGMLTRMAEDSRLEQERKSTLTIHGLTLGKKETDLLLRELERIAEASKSGGGFPIEVERDPNGHLAAYLRGGGVTADLTWQSSYLNYTDEAGLTVNYVGAMLRFGGGYVFLKQPPQLGTARYAFGLTKGLRPVWRRDKSGNEISTHELASDVISTLSNHIRKAGKF